MYDLDGSEDNGWPDARRPPLEAFHVESVVDHHSGAVTIGSVRHPGHAWCTLLSSAQDTEEATLWPTLGGAYLRALADVLGAELRESIHDEIWQALQRPQAVDEGK